MKNQITQAGILVAAAITSHVLGEGVYCEETAKFIGISPEVASGALSISTHILTKNVHDSLTGIKDGITKNVNSDLEKAILNAYKNSLSQIKKDIIKEYELEETKNEKIFRNIFNKSNEHHEIIADLDNSFLAPLLDELISEKTISEMLEGNEQINADYFLKKVIRNATPDYDKKEVKCLNEFVDFVCDKFKYHFRHYFRHELKSGDKAKTVYFTHLLEGIILSTKDLKKDFSLIRNFAEKTGINLLYVLRLLKKSAVDFSQFEKLVKEHQVRIEYKMDALHSKQDKTLELQGKTLDILQNIQNKQLEQNYKSNLNNFGSSFIFGSSNNTEPSFQNITALAPQVKKFLENGNYISAINVLLGGYKFEEVILRRQIEIIKIEQKSGFIKQMDGVEGARRHINILLGENKFSKYPTEIQAEILLLNLKILNQEGEYKHVINNYRKVISKMNGAIHDGLKCGAYHRVAIAFALYGNHSKANYFLMQSLEISTRLNIGHSIVTCKMFASICSVFSRADYGIEDPIKQLEVCGEEYFKYPVNHQYWQYNGLKSSVLCLFAEGSALLFAGEVEKGLMRLTAGNLFAYFTKAHPFSEGYAELLGFIPDGMNKDLIKLAMLPDTESQNLFQKVTPSMPRYLIDLEKSVSQAIKTPTVANWKKLRKNLQNLDKKYHLK